MKIFPVHMLLMCGLLLTFQLPAVAERLSDRCPVGAACRSPDICGGLEAEFNIPEKIETSRPRGCRADFLRVENRGGRYLLRQCQAGQTCAPVYATVEYGIPEGAGYPQSLVTQETLERCLETRRRTGRFPPDLQRECPLITAWAARGNGYPIFLAGDATRRLKSGAGPLDADVPYTQFYISYRIEKSGAELTHDLESYLYNESEMNIRLRSLNPASWSHRERRKAFNYCSVKKIIEWMRSGSAGFQNLYLVEIPVLDMSFAGLPPRLEVCAEAMFEATPTRPTLTDYLLQTPNGTLQAIHDGFTFVGDNVSIRSNTRGPR